MNRPYALPYASPQCPHCSNLNRTRRSGDLLPVDHFLRESRDPSSPIVCSELKSTQCQMCFALGHTRSHCPSQIKSWRSYASQNKVYENPKTLDKKLDKPELSLNKFSALLADESDSESDSDSSDPIYNRDGTFRPRSPDYPPPDWKE
jgi:hypothetical protein